MALKCGIVGLPNVGKSTLFNCVSSGKAQSANFPFCTIDPNIGSTNVPDKRLEVLDGFRQSFHMNGLEQIVDAVDRKGAYRILVVSGGEYNHAFGLGTFNEQEGNPVGPLLVPVPC